MSSSGGSLINIEIHMLFIGLLQPGRGQERLKAIVFLFPRPPAASPAAPAAIDGPKMIAGKLAAAGAARLGRTSRCHACRGGLRGPLDTRGMEARAYATQRLPPDHASGSAVLVDLSRGRRCIGDGRAR